MFSGCTGEQLVGEYKIVDLDKTLSSITRVPEPLANTTSLSEYRAEIQERYSDKSLRFNSRPPHAFMVPVPLEGSVEGLFAGGWMHDKTANTVLIYRWVSGSVYTLWGRGNAGKDGLTLTRSEPEPQIILHFRKRS
jgi:hypothetical protein